MQATTLVLISLLAVVLSGFVARATRLPLPFVQIALGATLHATGWSAVTLDPQLFFLLFLPPLLFLDGWRIPNDELRREARPIATMALGLVVFTVVGLGTFIHWLVPAMPLAVAFALAAVLSPTDPVAFSAITRRTPAPRRLLHILHGEALLNDASGLVCLRFAVAAAMTGAFSLPDALVSLVWTASGGLGIGIAVAWVVVRALSWASLRWGDDGGTPILTALLIPFAAYLLAERLHCSGILATVAAGVTMSAIDHGPLQAATRLRRTAVWDIVQLAANGSIFVLLGGQIPALLARAPVIVQATAHSNPWWLGAYVLLIVAALFMLRLGWVWTSLALARARSPRDAAARSEWRLVLATSLAGVRGAITLAAVLTLPLSLEDGTPFPARELAIFLAAGVMLGTLGLATVGLPAVLRGLEREPAPSRHGAEDDARTAAAEAALLAIATHAAAMAAAGTDAAHLADVVARLERLYGDRIERHGGDDSAEVRRSVDDIERALRLTALRAERELIDRMAADGTLGDATLSRLVRELDLLETRQRD